MQEPQQNNSVKISSINQPNDKDRLPPINISGWLTNVNELKRDTLELLKHRNFRIKKVQENR